MENDEADGVDGHQRMNQSGERQQKDGAQPCAIDAGGNCHEAQRGGKGARRDVRVHDKERGSGDGEGETCGRKEQGGPAR